MSKSIYVDFVLAYTFTPIYINLKNIVAVEPHNVYSNSMSVIRCVGECFTVIDRVQVVLDKIQLAESKFEDEHNNKRRR